MENKVSSSKPTSGISVKDDAEDASFIFSSTGGKASPTPRGTTSPRQASPTLSKCVKPAEVTTGIGSGDGRRYLSEIELCDPDLGYPRVANPNNRSNPRGVCLLINQRDFDSAKTGQERRDGTDVDADNIERTFIRCGYAVNRATNLTLRKMEFLLDDVRSQNHSKYDSFACVILSHGAEGIVYASDGTINVDRLIGYFRSDRCPTLAGKPKMFFIQACRGCKFDKGITLSTDASSDSVLVTKLPIEADIFVANSTFPGYYAWRNSHAGSWFIQELCKVIKAAQESGQHHDLASLLTVVARKVALLYESNTGQSDSHGSKQMVSVNSTLTRKAFIV
ncbi:caspase 3 apoptosis cysteine peptidase [Echinococcus multilocularis]|uniref:Caspase 3 apoptosis cysteine peptidase n=1 Tax=Echinococcus multilocularis TaxID=6211 RepID=A0A068Y2Q6_ECHMU|nr:caspase 3 apoptosis cysteine peptidase [Echinococcus multilocularis]